MITDKEIADNVIRAYKKQLIHAAIFEQEEDYVLNVLKDCLGKTDEDLKKDIAIAKKTLQEAGAKKRAGNTAG